MKKYELKNNKALGRYEFDLGGATAAVDYEECGPGCIAVTHTGVPDRFCGQGIASQLTLAVLEDLKRQGLKWFRCVDSWPVIFCGIRSGSRWLRTSSGCDGVIPFAPGDSFLGRVGSVPAVLRL